MNTLTSSKETLAYITLTMLIICGLATSAITGSKVIHFVIDFPFSNIVFSIFTYPLIDCICEIWGKRIANITVWLSLCSQLIFVLLIQLSIIMPHAAFWRNQTVYESVLGTSEQIMTASLIAFSLSQLLDVYLFQTIKLATRGKYLWLRSNVSTILGQILDSTIFILIVFYSSPNKLEILIGSVSIKIIFSVLMTPAIYLIIFLTNKYLQSDVQCEFQK